MAQEFKTKVFVIKRKDVNEADRVFTVFANDFGKIDVFAKSIRKIDSKLKSGIDLFYLSEISFVQGKKKTLTDAFIINRFSDIINNHEKFLTARKISKILDIFINGPEYDNQIFNLIVDVFQRLEKLEIENWKLEILFLHFVWNFFAILGYSPQLLKCAHCHGKLNENELYFSNKEGGVICKKCNFRINRPEQPALSLAEGSRRITSDIVKILRIILKNDWQIILKLKLNKDNLKSLKQISKNYYLYLLSAFTYGKHK